MLRNVTDKQASKQTIKQLPNLYKDGKDFKPLGFILFDPEIHLRKGDITLLEVESISGRWSHNLDETVGATPFYMRLNH